MKKLLLLASIPLACLLTGCTQHYDIGAVSPQAAKYSSTKRTPIKADNNYPAFSGRKIKNAILRHDAHFNSHYTDVPITSKEATEIEQAGKDPGLQFDNTEAAIDLRYANHEAPIQNRRFQKKYHTKTLLYPPSQDGNYLTYYFSHRHPCMEILKWNPSTKKLRDLYEKAVNATLCTDDVLAKYQTNEKPKHYKKYVHLSSKEEKRLDGLEAGLGTTPSEKQFKFNSYALRHKHYWRYYFSHKHPHYAIYEQSIKTTSKNN